VDGPMFELHRVRLSGFTLVMRHASSTKKKGITKKLVL
jgi:hypothetical protein